MVYHIESGMTKIQQNGKNIDGKVRYSIWIPRGVVRKLKLGRGTKVAFTMWIPDEPVQIVPEISKPSVPETAVIIENLPSISQDNPNEEETDFIKKYAQTTNDMALVYLKEAAYSQFGKDRTEWLIANKKKVNQNELSANP